MELLRILVDILLPVFLIVAVGAVAGRGLSLDAKTLSTIGYWILGPVFVFHILATTQVSAGLVGRMLVAITIAAVGSALVAWISATAIRRDASRRSAGVVTSAFGNAGNFGLAIVAFTYGDGALGLAGLAMIGVNTVGVLIGVSATQWHEHGAARALRVALTAPLTLAVIPGAAVNAWDFSLPLWIERPVALVAAALIPVMLLTLGVQLANMVRPNIGWDVVRPLLVKLVVSPLLAAGAAAVVGLTGTPAGVVILQLAMPPAVLTSIIAIEHDLEPDLVTTTVLIGTLASLVTLPIVILLVQ